MARIKGVAPFAANFESEKAAPLVDMYCETFADMLDATEQEANDGSAYMYFGRKAIVFNDVDPAKNGTYELIDVATTTTAAAWRFISGAGGTERGGVIFDATVDYKTGDVVTHLDHGYTFKADTPAAPWDLTKVEPLSKPTTTDPWITATAFTAGQLLYGTSGEGLFIVTTDYTSGATIAADVAAGDLVVAVHVPDEKGGIAHDSALNYVIGDIVSLTDKAYIAVNNNVGSVPAVGNADWVEIGLAGASIVVADEAALAALKGTSLAVKQWYIITSTATYGANVEVQIKFKDSANFFYYEIIDTNGIIQLVKI